MDFPPRFKIAPKIGQAEIAGTTINQRPVTPPARDRIPAPVGKWAFDGRRILHNGADVAHIIAEPLTSKTTTEWSHLAQQIEAFKFYFMAKRRKKKFSLLRKKNEEVDDPEISVVVALAEAYVEKITRKIKRRFDETADGLSFILDADGQMVINGMNVTAFIDMAKSHPSDKAKTFLKGLKNRLAILLANKSGSASYEGIRDKTAELMRQIDEEINRIVAQERLLKG